MTFLSLFPPVSERSFQKLERKLTIRSLSQAPPTEAAAFFKQVPTARKWGSSGYYMYRCNRSWSASFSFDGSDRQFTVSSEFSECSCFRR